MRAALLPAVLALAHAAAGCESAAPPPPAAPEPAFVLPRGDPEAGRQAFLDLQCSACHAVRGGGFPAPTIYPPVPFVLGEGWTEPPAEGWLATSLVNPSHEVLPGHAVLFHGTGEVYRMRDYGTTMTVGQLRDLVAFLRTLAAEGGDVRR